MSFKILIIEAEGPVAAAIEVLLQALAPAVGPVSVVTTPAVTLPSPTPAASLLPHLAEDSHGGESSAPVHSPSQRNRLVTCDKWPSWTGTVLQARTKLGCSRAALYAALGSGRPVMGHRFQLLPMAPVLAPSPADAPIHVTPTGRSSPSNVGKIYCSQWPGWIGTAPEAAKRLSCSREAIYNSLRLNRPTRGHTFLRMPSPSTPPAPTPTAVLRTPTAVPPTPNAARPTPNAQRPTPNVQRPTPNAFPPAPLPKYTYYMRCSNCGHETKREDYLPGACVSCRGRKHEEVRRER